MTKQDCFSRVHADCHDTKYMLEFTVKIPLQSYINSSLASSIGLMEKNILLKKKLKGVIR